MLANLNPQQRRLEGIVLGTETNQKEREPTAEMLQYGHILSASVFMIP